MTILDPPSRKLKTRSSPPNGHANRTSCKPREAALALARTTCDAKHDGMSGYSRTLSTRSKEKVPPGLSIHEFQARRTEEIAFSKFPASHQRVWAGRALRKWPPFRWLHDHILAIVDLNTYKPEIVSLWRCQV